jgi:hypothetical protein
VKQEGGIRAPFSLKLTRGIPNFLALFELMRDQQMRGAITA